MKRWFFYSLVLFIAFAAGFAIALHLTSRRVCFEEERFHRSIAELRQRIYGENHFHLNGVFPWNEPDLANFNPAESTGSITLSYTGGMGGTNPCLQLDADGSLYHGTHGNKQFLTTIPPDRCADIFRRVLSSGILNYSEGVIELKKALLSPNRWVSVTDGAITEIRVSVPELKAEQTVSIYMPDSERECFPDIIEFQIILQIEKELLDLVPKGTPPWN